MENKDLSKAIPIYTVVNVAKFPLNPYREFVHFCINNTYPLFEDMTKLSLDAFRQLSAEERVNIFNKVTEKHPEITFNIFEKTSHPRIFLEADVLGKGTKVCNVKFYTHLYYSESNKEKDDKEYVAAEIDFTDNPELDFLNINREFNVFDFTRSGEDPNTIDMFFAHLYALCNFTEFLKHFKTKTLIVKNIDMFANKMIRPWVQDMAILYSANEFSIGSICGEEINKDVFPYDNYLNSVKKYAEEIKAKYGDKYKIENDAKEKEQEKN
jgi:hypothetical protein